MIIDIRKIIFKVIGIIVFITIAIFSYYQYRFYVNGPEIVDINIQNHMETKTPSLSIKATLSNTKNITINGKDISIINKKNINELVVFSPGNNIIKIVLKDAFGKDKSYLYNIYYLTDHKEYKTLKELKESEQKKDLIINNN